jgi:hypothetical protein
MNRMGLSLGTVLEAPPGYNVSVSALMCAKGGTKNKYTYLFL